MKQNKTSFLLLLAVLLIALYFLRDKKTETEVLTEETTTELSIEDLSNEAIFDTEVDTDINIEETKAVEKKAIEKEKVYSIDELTQADLVVAYLKKHGELPDYYITKKEASNLGWIASKGNLCDVLPGKAIGGDYFGNREGKLPKKNGRKYYEADLNYDCGRRNADRVVYSNDGLIFLTFDHYKSFKKQ